MLVCEFCDKAAAVRSGAFITKDEFIFSQFALQGVICYIFFSLISRGLVCETDFNDSIMGYIIAFV